MLPDFCNLRHVLRLNGEAARLLGLTNPTRCARAALIGGSIDLADAYRASCRHTSYMDTKTSRHSTF